ncbi:sigma factor [Actinomadura sp. DC4]|uniref:sigma factor n=1 Tax=Actinomadura sp. DC4 TaxID=3055069 RepID=UPI0025AF150E|nr:sigma factor [Actinomadura sp. DC4]MDN3353063.1 sigma factor [Actinomadura sp. DC4]
MARWSRYAPDADRRLVKGLHDGDDDVLATLYDVYAERLYDYCMALLDDSRAAADVIHDTFVDASRRSPRMRDRAKLRAWLYAAARRRCMQRKLQHEAAEGDPLAGLDFLQREALFLALRHDLTGEDLATTLGVSLRRSEARLKRAQDQVPEAEEFLDKAAAPVIPAALRHRVQHTGTDPELAGYRAEIAARGGALTPEGMPRQPDAPSHLARRWAFTSAGLLTALATALVALMLMDPNLPVPSIEWPGGRPHTSTPPSAHTRRQGAQDPEPGGGRDQQRPTTAPQSVNSPTPTPTHSRRPGPRTGALAVSPTSIRFRDHTTMAAIILTAEGGPVTWTAATSSPQVTLMNAGGTIRAHGHVTVQVTLNRGLLTLPGTATITVSGGTGPVVPVGVAWDISVL